MPALFEVDLPPPGQRGKVGLTIHIERFDQFRKRRVARGHGQQPIEVRVERIHVSGFRDGTQALGRRKDARRPTDAALDRDQPLGHDIDAIQGRGTARQHHTVGHRVQVGHRDIGIGDRLDSFMPQQSNCPGGHGHQHRAIPHGQNGLHFVARQQWGVATVPHPPRAPVVTHQPHAGRHP